MTLPPLPLPGLCMDVGTGFRKWYSADQMQAYATAAVLAERETCAKVCEDLDAFCEDDPGSSAAAAIRARATD